MKAQSDKTDLALLKHPEGKFYVKDRQINFLIFCFFNDFNWFSNIIKYFYIFVTNINANFFIFILFNLFLKGFPASSLSGSIRDLLVGLMRKCDQKSLGTFYISLIAGMTADIQQGESKTFLLISHRNG